MKQYSRRTLLRDGALAMGAFTVGHSLLQAPRAQAAAASEITVTDLGHAKLLQGAGGNVVVIPGLTEDGLLMIDGGLAKNSDALLAAAFKATGQNKVHTLFNTHFHPEQTGSNERIGAAGGHIIAHENTKMFLQNSLLSATYEGRYGPLAAAGIPTQTLRGDGRMKFAGQEIVYGYLPAAHTNGDLFLFFPMLDTLICGGPVTVGEWPLLDIRQGGWIGGLVNAYEKLADIVSADTVVVPAHGPATDGTALIRMRNMYSELHLTLAEQLNIGMGWDDVVAQNPLQAYETRYGSAARFLELAQRSMQMANVPD
jgi:glyoxylase-like metal-dependent hydrolase (beta-lactamase superfamily II)